MRRGESTRPKRESDLSGKGKVTMVKSSLLISVEIATAILLIAQPVAAQRYDVIDINDPVWGGDTTPQSINDLGIVAGNDWDQLGETRGYAWNVGTLTWVPSLVPFGETEVHDISNTGIIVGASTSNTSFRHATAWDSVLRTVTNLFPASDTSYAWCINNSGWITGSATVSGQSMGFLYRDGSVVDLGALVNPWSVGESGVIVGSDEPLTTAYTWADGTLTALPTLEPGDLINARDINASGTIVGYGTPASLIHYGVIWKSGTVVHSGTLTPGRYSLLSSINDSGVAVGQSGVDEPFVPTARGVIWQNNILMNVNDLIDPDIADVRIIKDLNDINNSGQIAADSHAAEQPWEDQAVLLVPRNEGLTLSSFLPGIAGTRNTLQAIHASPSSRVAFVYGFDLGGATDVPGCGGLRVEISAPVLAGVTQSNGSGVASLSIFVPNPAAGLRVVVQAVDLDGCEVSPPGWIRVPD